MIPQSNYYNCRCVGIPLVIDRIEYLEPGNKWSILYGLLKRILRGRFTYADTNLIGLFRRYELVIGDGFNISYTFNNLSPDLRRYLMGARL